MASPAITRQPSSAKSNVPCIGSTTVMVCWQVDLLPHSSVASQVWVATNVFEPVTLVTAPNARSVTAPQLSVAVGCTKLHESPAGTLRFGGHVMVGGVVSTTVIVCTTLVLKPDSSMAVHVRVTTLVPAQPLLTTSL